MIGRRVGVYELKREIGRGGMGAVYLAERIDGEFDQRVAIKLIKRGMDTDLILKRFRRERQIVATLDHPNIAHFLSGGSTEDGLPYFVMEFVEGRPLYEFFAENETNFRGRLEIFRKICEAVDAAHRSGVIHRDLKPSNILVKPDGTPKLLDFGIAKVLDPDFSVTEIDSTGALTGVMTLEYASPEQISGEAPIAPASDVYSLGVLFFELVTGRRPYKLNRRNQWEVRRVICEEAPAMLSKASAGKNPSIDVLRYVPEKDDAGLKFGDQKISGGISSGGGTGSPAAELELIASKALRKKPSERYASARAFAEDVSRFLAGEPVRAEAFPPENIRAEAESAAGTAAAARSKLSGRKSIAVLPLKVISADSAKNTDEDLFLGFGLADALVSRLSNVKRLLVRPTSAVTQFAETNPLETGKIVNVEYVLSGAIRRVGERLRISVQLLNVAEEASVWAEKFDEKYTDVLELEDSISERVSEQVLPKLTGEEKRRLNKRGTDSAEAFEAYMRARFFWNQVTPESFPKMIRELEKAVAIDPEYALAHASIADFYNWAAIHGLFPTDVASSKVFESANRALEIDQTLAEAHAALGLFYSSRFEFERSEEIHRRAIKLAPDYPLAHEWLGAMLIGTGRFEEGLAQTKLAEELDFFSLRSKILTAWALYQVGRFEEALAKGREVIALDPHSPQGYLQIGNAALELGLDETALENCEKAFELMQPSEFGVYYYCFALVRSGQSERARRLVRELEEKAKSAYVSPYFLAMANVAVEDSEAAFEHFEKAFEEKNHWLVWFGTEPKLAALRRDERYLNLFERMKNPLADKQRREAARKNRRKSIAVLPLRIIGGASGDEEYLSLGLADAMITRLSNVRRIVVRPTAAVLRYAETENVVQAGRELDTDFVLSGTIRRGGTRLRISARLTDTRTETVLWADKFNEEFTDILDLEDAVAEKIGNLLIPQITGEEQKKLSKRGTNNPRAYEAYLKARYNLYQLTPETYQAAKNYFEEAVRLDPEYALARVGLADFYFTQTTFGTMPPLEAFEKARRLAERALEIDGSLGEACTVLGFVKFIDFDFDAMERDLRRSIRLNPNIPLAHIWLSCLLTLYGKSEEAFAEAARAVEINPVSLFERFHQAWIFYHHRQFEKAERLAKKALEAEPNFSHGLAVYSRTANGCGDFEKSLEAARRAFELNQNMPWIAANYAAALACAGERREARKILDELENLSRDIYVTPYCLAVAHLQLKDADRALALLEEAFRTRDIWLTWITADPQLDALRSDPRFEKIVERLIGN